MGESNQRSNLYSSFVEVVFHETRTALERLLFTERSRTRICFQQRKNFFF